MLEGDKWVRGHPKPLRIHRVPPRGYPSTPASHVVSSFDFHTTPGARCHGKPDGPCWRWPSPCNRVHGRRGSHRTTPTVHGSGPLPRSSAALHRRSSLDSRALPSQHGPVHKGGSYTIMTEGEVRSRKEHSDGLHCRTPFSPTNPMPTTEEVPHGRRGNAERAAAARSGTACTGGCTRQGESCCGGRGGPRCWMRTPQNGLWEKRLARGRTDRERALRRKCQEGVRNSGRSESPVRR